MLHEVKYLSGSKAGKTQVVDLPEQLEEGRIVRVEDDLARVKQMQFILNDRK